MGRVVYTSGELQKLTGLDRNRVRRIFKKVVKYHGEYSKENKTSKQRKPIIIPKKRLKELVEEMKKWR